MEMALGFLKSSQVSGIFLNSWEMGIQRKSCLWISDFLNPKGSIYLNYIFHEPVEVPLFKLNIFLGLCSIDLLELLWMEEKLQRGREGGGEKENERMSGGCGCHSCFPVLLSKHHFSSSLPLTVFMSSAEPQHFLQIHQCHPYSYRFIEVFELRMNILSNSNATVILCTCSVSVVSKPTIWTHLYVIQHAMIFFSKPVSCPHSGCHNLLALYHLNNLKLQSITLQPQFPIILPELWPHSELNYPLTSSGFPVLTLHLMVQRYFSNPQ